MRDGGSADYADRGTVTQSHTAPGRHLKQMLAGVLLASVLTGCGMSNITSGLGSSIFGGGEKKSGEIASVTEEQLLLAAKSGNQGDGGGTARVAHDCPKFQIWPNDRYYTAYEAGRAGDGLAIIHRGELTKTARECSIEPGRITLKYGFSGRVLLGPRGQPGTVTLPVEVHVTDANRQKIQSDSMTVKVDILPDKPIGYFSIVRTVSFAIPEGTRPADYKLYVAFQRPKQSG